MILLGMCTILYLLVTVVKDSRQHKAPKTVDVFVLVTLVFDVVMLLAWWVTPYIQTEMWCQ
ncbi:hypothetical protein KIPB_016317, partial [Kipferlia bialata]|eukprot:g16317.t1